MKNKTCKGCGERFHTCSSCDISDDWEYEYCSNKCWKASDSYKKLTEASQLLDRTLTPEQRAALNYILERADDGVVVLMENMTGEQQ